MSESPIVLHGFVKWLINYCFSVSFACALTWGCKSSQVSKLKGAADGHHIPDIWMLIWWHLGLWCRNWRRSHKWRVGKSLFLHLPIYQKSCSVNWDFRTVYSTKRNLQVNARIILNNTTNTRYTLSQLLLVFLQQRQVFAVLAETLPKPAFLFTLWFEFHSHILQYMYIYLLVII